MKTMAYQLADQQAVRRQLEAQAEKMIDLAREVLVIRGGEPRNAEAARGWLEMADILKLLAQSIPDEGPMNRLSWRPVARQEAAPNP
jgi:hypothetical protein